MMCDVVRRDRPFTRRLFQSLLLFALLAVGAYAQSVSWEPSDSGIATAVQLVFDNCAPDGDPELPAIPGVTFSFAGRAESMNIINFKASRTVRLTYILRARQNTPVQIPAFTVKTDKGAMRVAAFTTNAPAPALDALATAKLIPERTTVWAGEVFGLSYELSASRRANLQNVDSFTWNPAPLVAEDWSKPEISESTTNGDRRVNWTSRTRAIARTPNTMKLEAASQVLTIQTGQIGTFFGPQPRMEQVSVTSEQPIMDVKPLPAGAPAAFRGAVGDFKLTSKVVPEKAAIGEPVTWTLELSGTGNWPDISGLPARDVSNDFQVVQPKAKRTPAEGKLFDVTLSEDVVLVPTKPGTYTLGPIKFSFFNPKTGAYETKTTEAKTITITPPAAPQFGGIQPAAKEAPKAEPGKTESPAGNVAEPALRGPVSAAPLPSGIPRDPLPGAEEARAPLTPGTLWLGVLSPVAAVLLLWLGLAVRQAKRTDPVRPRREARDRIVKTLSHLQTAGENDGAALLLAWQHDAAVLWQVAQAAPRATAMPDSTWAALWSEADRALYGPRNTLPPDWIARAQEALAAKRVPGFQPLRLFLPQNLWPFAAMLVCAFIFSAASRAWAEQADAAYRKGEFAAAEKAWRDRVAAAPTDWIARHNLSLALAQQERAGEAAGQAAAAFVQNPSHPAVRWHFALAADKMGAAPAALTGFIASNPLHTIAAALSPADWQRVIILAAWCAGIAAGWLLFNAYGRRARWVIGAAVTLLALSLTAIGIAFAGVRSYGLAVNADAVVVTRAGTLRSVPTEADISQKTSPLAAGAMAIADKSFLGWRRLAFENGQTGWVRKEEIVPLWK
jgi:hypothetical protein